MKVSPKARPLKVIYIAGPFRAPTAWQIEQNVRHAETLALEVWRRGAAALCPHTNSRFYHGEGSDEIFLEGGLELLRRSDALILVDHWQHSAGTKAEIDLARSLGLPVFGTFGSLEGLMHAYPFNTQGADPW
jgi:nucleoside 2-deoxyribosyltransferase